jgi:hypothetical protein
MSGRQHSIGKTDIFFLLIVFVWIRKFRHPVVNTGPETRPTHPQGDH